MFSKLAAAYGVTSVPLISNSTTWFYPVQLVHVVVVLLPVLPVHNKLNPFCTGSSEPETPSALSGECFQSLLCMVLKMS